MTIITSAEKLPVHNIEMSKGKKFDHIVNLRRQRALGIALVALCIGAILFVQDVEALLTFVPFGLYLTFTKKDILEFEDE